MGTSLHGYQNPISYSNFNVSQPLTSYLSPPPFRLEAIAADAELQEKSLSELEGLADTLHEACQEAELEHRARCVVVIM